VVNVSSGRVVFGVRRLAVVACVLGVGLAALATVAFAVQAPVRGGRSVAGQTGQGEGGQTGSGSPGSAPVASATLEQCLTAADEADRSATFNGQMQTIPGAFRMAMEIVVQERTSDETGFRTLSAPGLDVWQRSETGVKIYKDVRQVTDLPAPAAFRAVVQFRWLNEKGRVIKSTARRTTVCRQAAPPAKAQPTPPSVPAPAPAPASATTSPEE
jgi:hypothetical protein